jgi:hypothetical protein
MNKNQRLRYEMFLRVRDFGHVHRDRFPESSTAGKAFAAVAAAVADLEAHAMAGLLTAEEGRKARDAARDALVDRLTAIARTARVIARALPGADAVFRMPAERSDTSLLTTARAFISEGQAVKNRFVPLGMPDDFLTGLQKVVDTYDQAIGGRRAGRTGLAAARAGMKTAIAQGLDAVRTLDVVVANTLQDDPVVLAAWKRGRQQMSKAKGASAGVKAQGTKPEGPTPTPAAPAAASPDAATMAGPAVAVAPEAAAPPAPVAPEEPLKRAS